LQPFIGPGVTCDAPEPLLNGANPVPDIYFTASSEHSDPYLAHNARMDGVNKWWAPTPAELAATPTTMYLQASEIQLRNNTTQL